ncbi:MAG TPA: anti-sigma factor [Chloroflexia bacterium]|nr:anti-sigma factor [Chloroflexia bacterium]
MPFQPEVNQQLSIDGITYLVAEHPVARGIPYGQEGRQAVVYQLVAGNDKRAIKAFKSRYQMPSMVSLAKRLAPHADLPGLQVCRRSVLSPQQHDTLLNAYPDLLYAVLMPWIEGPTWMEVLLEKRELTPNESLSIARAFAGILSGMEQEGLAHCDLSGPNLLLPIFAPGPATYQAPVALVDVEQMYGPDLRKPEVLPGGSPGYAHKSAPEGLWSANADRFAGAVLMSEILAWCDPRVRDAAWGESYFDPQEMQRDGERYTLLITTLTETWGANVARMFERAWTSQTLADCPSFGQWLVSLPKSVPAAAGDQPPVEAPAGTSEVSVRTLMELASRFEAQGNLSSALAAYQQALSLPDVGSALASELTLIIGELEKKLSPQPIAPPAAPVAQAAPPAPQAPPRKNRVDSLFDQGLGAYNRGEWREARELLTEVVRAEPNYSFAGQSAAALLAESERRIAPIPQAAAPVSQTTQSTQAAPVTPAAPAEVKSSPSTIDRLTRIVVPATLALLLLVFGAIVFLQLQGTPRPAASGNDGGATATVPAGAQNTPSGSGAASSPVPEDTTVFLGLIRFTDGSATLDQAGLFVEKFPAPPAGKQYQVWLLGAGGERRRPMGVLQLDADGRGTMDMTDEEGVNLLRLYDAFEITNEPDPDSSPELPSREIAFSGALPAEAYTHMKHVLVEGEETPAKVGWSLGLLREAELVVTIAREMVTAQQSGDLERMRLDAEGLLNLIEGENGANFGDVNKDGRVTKFGDSFGLLLNGDRLGYIEGLIAHTQNVTRAPDATDNIKIHADHTIVSAQNLGDWVGELRTLALKIAQSTSVDEVGGDVRNASSLADRILNGRDQNGDEKVDPTPGEGGAKTAYQHAQYMADLFILRDSAQNPAGTGTPPPHAEEGEHTP